MVVPVGEAELDLDAMFDRFAHNDALVQAEVDWRVRTILMPFVHVPPDPE